jgi:esterase FrsA
MYCFDLDPQQLLDERSEQMKGWGIPERTLSAMRHSIKDMWSSSAGGWCFEWARCASDAERSRNWLKAAMLYGAAKFPVTNTDDRKRAFADQIRCYLLASSGFHCAFERRSISVEYRGKTEHVPLHIYQRRAKRIDPTCPVIFVSGGVDTWKIEMHRLWVALAQFGGFRVVALDMPGTGESTVSLASDSEIIYQSVIQAFQSHRAVKTGILGVSFGGHWAAKLALLGSVTAAVDIGGPVGLEPGIPEPHSYPNGMAGIVGCALGLSSAPTAEQLRSELARFYFCKQGLTQATPHTPLLVINGSDDPYVPMSDTTGFRNVPGARVWLVNGAYHCAAEKLPRIMPGVIAWLRSQLHGRTAGSRIFESLTRAVLPALA